MVDMLLSDTSKCWRDTQLFSCSMTCDGWRSLLNIYHPTTDKHTGKLITIQSRSEQIFPYLNVVPWQVEPRQMGQISKPFNVADTVIGEIEDSQLSELGHPHHPHQSVIGYRQLGRKKTQGVQNTYQSSDQMFWGYETLEQNLLSRDIKDINRKKYLDRFNWKSCLWAVRFFPQHYLLKPWATL